jgi:hypothetical protein
VTESAWVTDGRWTDDGAPTVCPNDGGHTIDSNSTVIRVVDRNRADNRNPTVNDDDSLDYIVGDRWTNLSSGAEFECTDTTDGAAVWQQTSTGAIGAPPYSSDVSDSAIITTSSTTHILATNMTITPPAGTYMVTFTASVSHTSNNQSVFMQIAVDGVSQGIELVFKRGAGQGNVYGAVTCRAKVTVTGSEAIKGCWRTTNASAEMRGRSLSIVEVS